MPSYFEKKNIPEEYDRRRKLTPEDKERIRTMYHFERMAIHAIAREFAGICSRRMIQFVLFPERMHKVNFSGHYKNYYDKDKHRGYMQTHRAHKRKLDKENKLIEPGDAKPTCSRCGSPVTKSEVKGYSWQCAKCDEDLYSFEVNQPGEK